MKYSGGYQIIDLGDLSAFDDNGVKTIPGIFDRVSQARKPIILTGEKQTPATIGSRDLAECRYTAGVIGSGNPIVFTSLFSDQKDGESISVNTKVIITKDDRVTITTY